MSPLAAALAVLERDGPDQLTMRAVAAEAGVTATALYRHYADQQALLAALVTTVYQGFREAMLAASPAPASLGSLRVAFDRYLRYALEHPQHYRLLFVEPHRLKIDRYPSDFVSGRSPTFKALRDIVAGCMAVRLLRAGEPADVALTLYAHMHGLIMLHFAGRFGDDARVFEAFFHRSLDHVIDGLARG
jgi:AcrR family transcriptional regulator